MEETEIKYGEIWFNDKEYILRGYDGEKWVTKEETFDPYLKGMLESLEIMRPQ
jgi:hypothetical protein